MANLKKKMRKEYFKKLKRLHELASYKKNDEVETIGGIGKVLNSEGDYIYVKLGKTANYPGSEVKYHRRDVHKVSESVKRRKEGVISEFEEALMEISSSQSRVKLAVRDALNSLSEIERFIDLKPQNAKLSTQWKDLDNEFNRILDILATGRVEIIKRRKKM